MRHTWRCVGQTGSRRAAWGEREMCACRAPGVLHVPCLRAGGGGCVAYLLAREVVGNRRSSLRPSPYQI